MMKIMGTLIIKRTRDDERDASTMKVIEKAIKKAYDS